MRLIKNEIASFNSPILISSLVLRRATGAEVSVKTPSKTKA